jgi:hypothetical protein
MNKNNPKRLLMRYIPEPKNKIFFSEFLENIFLLIDLIFLVRVKMDSTGSQQNSTGGNVILLNNNDLLQQRTSLGNGQQVLREIFFLK